MIQAKLAAMRMVSLALLVGLGLGSVPGGALAQSRAAPPPNPSERDLIGALEERRRQLDQREQALDRRVADLVAREAALEERARALDAAATELRQQRERLAGRREENLRRAARIYDAMRPTQAAAIFNTLDPGLTVEILRLMNRSRVPQILGQMEPERARIITVGLSG
ncbi:MAG: hypothetical protein EAZ99_08760 [Alphaproteobacteria bacterium]|nr:hypothetical protein [Alphaproteobacteria bacterium]TAD89710.1 MAG: hypothetical protein EAZ99_08760 [Alphaproteobacteria bacterium]